MNGVNIGMLVNMLKSGGNPQSIVQNLIGQSGNPMINNVQNMLVSGNYNGIETICRNICKERGIDINQLMSEVKTKYNI